MALTTERRSEGSRARDNLGRSAVNVSSRANGALGEHGRHETHGPFRILEVPEPQPIGSAFEPEIEIPQSGEFIGGQDDLHTLGSADDGTSSALSVLCSAVRAHVGEAHRVRGPVARQVRRRV